jgi:hypothetical protein
MLAKAFRFTRPIAGRSRPSPDDSVVDQPTEFYTVKDPHRNPFYGVLLHMKRPGNKYLPDPFTEHAEKQDWTWRAKYEGQALEFAGPPSYIFFFGFFVWFQMAALFYWEGRWKALKENPLGWGYVRAIEG